jgi:hypothetical protein
MNINHFILVNCIKHRTRLSILSFFSVSPCIIHACMSFHCVLYFQILKTMSLFCSHNWRSNCFDCCKCPPSVHHYRYAPFINMATKSNEDVKTVTIDCFYLMRKRSVQITNITVSTKKKKKQLHRTYVSESVFRQTLNADSCVSILTNI